MTEFLEAIRRAAEPDTGGALRDVSVLVRRLAFVHPDWTEAACWGLAGSPSWLVRVALVDSYQYLIDNDLDLAVRLLQKLATDEHELVNQRARAALDEVDRLI